MWGSITLEPGPGDDIAKAATKAYEFMMENQKLAHWFSFYANGKTIDMTPYEDYTKVHKRPSEIMEEYWEGRR